MGIQEGILLLVLAGAIVYLVKYIRQHYFSAKAGGDDACARCKAPEARKDVDGMRSMPKS